MAAVIIGVDPHKASHTAVVISAAEEPLGEVRAGRWGEVFDDGVADAIIARLVHHAEVIASRATATGSKTVTRPRPSGHCQRRLKASQHAGGQVSTAAGSKFGIWHSFREVSRLAKYGGGAGRGSRVRTSGV
jgi:hypothetical protein